jgi:predicted ATPase
VHRTDLLPSDILAGRYAIERLGASGGVGTLYCARDLTSQESVAVKVLRGLHADGARSAARFLREAKTLRALRHPAIVRYLDHGVDPRVGPFLVMEWIDGEPLDAVLRERGLRPRDAFVLARRLTLALAYCHEERIVHRDVKPSNILLPGGRAEEAMLVDFGIAIDADGGTRSTQTGMVLGTPRYMAPEQLRSSRSVDGRADVFGLGCILYESLTGKHPFGGDDVYSYAARLVSGDAPAASAVRSSLPEEASVVAGRMIAREAATRPRADDALVAEIDAAMVALEGLALDAVAVAPEGDDYEPSASRSHATLPTYGEIAPAPARARAEPEVRGPLPVGRFVGRAAEHAELVARLGAAGGIGSVWGAPGIGKSRLALEVCQSLVREGGGRAGRTGFIVDLRGARDRADVLRAVLAILGAAVPPGGLDAEVAGVGRMLRAWGDPVVVFDGADHVLDDVAVMASAWASPRIGATVIVTARARARMEEQIAIELGPLAATEGADGVGPGVELLLGAAGVRRDGVDDAQMRAAVRVVEALDGNALALELAAARVPVLGLVELADRLDRPLALLGAARGADALSMSDALEWSFQLLAPHEQRALAECAVFHGPFSARAAEATLTSASEAPGVIDVLAALRRSSLLGEARVGGEVRLVLARTVREFARGKLSADDAAAAEKRRNAHLASWAWGLAGEIARTGSASALARLAEDAEQVLLAAEGALAAPESSEEQARVGLRAAVALEPVVAMRGPVERYLELLDRGLGAIPGGDELVGHARRVRGGFAGRRGAHEAAREDLEEALAIGIACRARDLEADARLALGALHQWSQRFDDAARMYRSVLEAPRGGQRLRAEARALGNLAAIAHDEQRFDEAGVLYDESIALLEALGDERLAAQAGVNSAVLLQERGRRAEARARYVRAAEALTALGDDRFLGISLGNLGMLDFEEGRLDGALANEEKARTLLARAGDLRSEALALGRLSAILAMMGRTREALGAAVQAERMAACHDAVARGAVRLFRAFVDVGRAREARVAGDAVTAENELLAARARVRHATTAPKGDTAVVALSDDARTALRVLESWMSSA